jgi:hypothetical protein
MKPQRPTRERAPARPGKREPRGNTHAARDGQPEPRLPHEHDQSSDSQVLGNEQARKLMRQAASDVDRGLVDRTPLVPATALSAGESETNILPP